MKGEGPLARLTIQSSAVAGDAVIPTAIEQFDLQNPETLMWGYDTGWQEAEYNTTLGVWRWTSGRATLRIAGPPVPVRVTLSVESPARYFGEPATVRVLAGTREIAVLPVSSSQDLTFDVPADALARADGLLTIETDKTFVPAERDGTADYRRLGLRVFGIRVSAR